MTQYSPRNLLIIRIIHQSESEWPKPLYELVAYDPSDRSILGANNNAEDGEVASYALELLSDYSAKQVALELGESVTLSVATMSLLERLIVMLNKNSVTLEKLERLESTIDSCIAKNIALTV